MDDKRMSEIQSILREFEDFIKDSLEDGMGGDIEDNRTFIKDAWDVFEELQENMEDDL